MSSKPDIKLKGYNALFGVDDSRRIVTLPLKDLHQHPGLHVTVAQDGYLDELTASIKKNGLFEEVRAFPDPEGGYWIISGRHRCEAARKAGLQEVPAILDDSMTREEAEIAITDCNLRHKLGIMEKAWTYRIKREAESRQGYRSDLHGQREQREKPTESERNIQRYIRLTYLVPALRARIESLGASKLPVRTGAALSYLSDELQEMVALKITETGKIPDMKTAESWKRLFLGGNLSERYLWEWFALSPQKEPSYSISLSAKQLAPYLPKSYTKQEADQLILQLLKDWSKKQEGSS